MRFSLPLALVPLATAVTLASAPASAAECSLGRAAYQSKEAPSFTMHFKEVSREKSDTRLEATIYEGLRGNFFTAPRVAELTFTYSMGYSVEYALGTSTAIETSPGETPLHSRVLAFRPDFSLTGVSGGPSTAAPYAIVLPELAQQLYNATRHDPKRQASLPEGAWILLGCR